ncbi:hypothetical protein E4U61_004083 [Claviceps capensis]|nr:hypothetical protein E4U61_004083 [Claviceps capensis]
MSPYNHTFAPQPRCLSSYGKELVRHLPITVRNKKVEMQTKWSKETKTLRVQSSTGKLC